MERLYIWSNFLWFDSFRRGLARPIRLCSIFKYKQSNLMWLVFSEWNAASFWGPGMIRNGKGRDCKSISPYLPSPLSPVIDLSTLANTGRTWKRASYAWLLSPTLGLTQMLLQIVQLQLIPQIKPLIKPLCCNWWLHWALLSSSSLCPSFCCI